LERIGIEFAIDKLVVIGHREGYIVGIDEDHIDTLMDLPLYALGVFE
jgi:hypothetical protein